MSEPVLFDSSAWIQALRKEFDPAIKSLLERYLGDDRILITPIIKVELLAGTRSEKDFLRLKSRLDALTEIPLGRNAWERVQTLAHGLRRRGLDIPLVDTTILVCAQIARARLFHRDRHFEAAKKFARVETVDLRAGADQ